MSILSCVRTISYVPEAPRDSGPPPVPSEWVLDDVSRVSEPQEVVKSHLERVDVREVPGSPVAEPWVREPV